MIFIVKHIEIEGPGTLGRFFENARKEVKTIELWKGERLPDSFTSVEAAVVLGGPMNVYEQDKYPFLEEEEIFLRKVLTQDIPVLGICLGAQLLAKAGGAIVKKAEQKEIGWYDIKLSEDGKEDPLFTGVDMPLRVFQWHEDTFDVPKGAKLLATSEKCKNQAFKIGKYGYGLQFHVEVTEAIIKRWEGAYFKDSGASLGIKRDAMIKEYHRLRERFNRQAQRMYLNFLNIAEQKK